jgi:hypothetical protein
MVLTVIYFRELPAGRQLSSVYTYCVRHLSLSMNLLPLSVTATVYGNRTARSHGIVVDMIQSPLGSRPTH